MIYEEWGCEPNMGAKEFPGKVEDPVKIGDYEFVVVFSTPICSVVFSCVHNSIVTHIDNTKHWLDPRLGFLPDGC